MAKFRVKKTIFNLLLLFIVGSVGAYSEDFSEKEFAVDKNNSATILTTSKGGLRFKKENNSDGTFGIIYDCSSELLEGGTVELYDDMHPENLKFLIIQNCCNISLSLWRDPHSVKSYNFNLEMLRIKNVKSVTVNSNKSSFPCKEYNSLQRYKHQQLQNSKFPFLLIYLVDIEILKIESYALCELKGKNITLKLQNVTINYLPGEAISNDISNLYLKNVKIKTVSTNAIYLTKHSKSIVTVRDSYFENINYSGFNLIKSEVEIHNNSFKNLTDNAFLVNATKYFTFSENYVNKLGSAFHVESPKIDVVRNTFEKSKKPWLSGFFTTKDEEEYSTVNISGNTLNFLPLNFFLISKQNLPDQIYFENNYFNCTCKYFRTFSSYSEKFTNFGIGQELLLNQKSENFCINFGNCTLYKVLSQITEVCLNKFVCSEEPVDSLKVYLKSILSTLNVISHKMDLLTAENNSAIVPEENLIKAEWETTQTLI